MPKKYWSKSYEIKPEMPTDSDVCFMCGQIDYLENMRLDKAGFYVHSGCEGKRL